jgi:hypothetical protein
MFIADGELANSGCASSHQKFSEIAQRFGVTQSCQ